MATVLSLDIAEKVFSARRLLHGQTNAQWSLRGLEGQLIELSAGHAPAGLSVCFSLVLQAQQSGEPVAWISARQGVFYPPDAIQYGVDLRGLPVIQVADANMAGRAADKLLRSEAFGLVIVDLGKQARIASPLMGRLMQLSKKHRSICVLLTKKTADMGMMNALISMHVQASKQALGEGRYSCDIRVLRDKRTGMNQNHHEVYYGPPGLR